MGERDNVRVLVEELGAVVDLIVNNHVDVAAGVVLSNILHGELLCRGHDCGVGCGLAVVERRELELIEVLSRGVVARTGGRVEVGEWKRRRRRRKKRRKEEESHR